nr:hypothetical protein [Pseudomonas benzenivorans]
MNDFLHQVAVSGGDQPVSAIRRWRLWVDFGLSRPAETDPKRKSWMVLAIHPE